MNPVSKQLAVDVVLQRQQLQDMLEAGGHRGDLRVEDGVAEPLGEVEEGGRRPYQPLADLVHALGLRNRLDLLHAGGGGDVGRPLGPLADLQGYSDSSRFP